MRKISLGLGISIDGYIARPDGAVDYLFMPEDFSMAEYLASMDAAIMGRKTYEVVSKMGSGFGDLAPYVFSRTLPPGTREGVTFVDESPSAFIERFRQQPGKDVWLMGGGELAREFLKEDLVDEIYLGIVPVLLGRGIPLFPSGFPQRDFSLVDNKSFSRGLVTLTYKRSRSEPQQKA